MADIIFTGDAANVVEVRTGTLDSYDAATTYKVAMGGRVVSTVGTGGDTSTTATALRALLNASTYPEFAEVTWSGATNAIIGTKDLTGTTFVATLTVSGGTGTVTDFAVTTAAAGANVVCADNFINASTGARGLPTNSDTLYFQDSDIDLYWALEALGAVTLTALHIKASYTGAIGLPFLHDASTDYQEYRPRHFKVGATNYYIGEGPGDGSPLIRLNLSTIQSAGVVEKMDDTEDEFELPALQIKGTHASNTLTVRGGTVALAPDDDDAAVILTLIVSGDAYLFASRNCTLTTVTFAGESTGELSTAATTVNIHGTASVIRQGLGTWATCNCTTGTLDDRSSGTISTLNIGDGATVTNDASGPGKTYTTVVVAGDFTLKDNNHRVTFTNAISPGQGSVLDGTLELGNARTLLPGAP